MLEMKIVGFMSSLLLMASALIITASAQADLGNTIELNVVEFQGATEK